MDQNKIIPNSVDKLSLYSTFTNFGLQEASLIWNRYAAFLVLEGFIVGGLLSFGKNIGSYTFLVLSIAGLLVTIVWHVLNYLGWLKQNEFYYYAAKLNINSNNGILLPTDEYPSDNSKCGIVKYLRPNSPIYLTAQVIPIVFIISYSYIIANKGMFLSSQQGEVNSKFAILIVVVAIIVFGLEYCFLMMNGKKISDREKMQQKEENNNSK